MGAGPQRSIPPAPPTSCHLGLVSGLLRVPPLVPPLLLYALHPSKRVDLHRLSLRGGFRPNHQEVAVSRLLVLPLRCPLPQGLCAPLLGLHHVLAKSAKEQKWAQEYQIPKVAAAEEGTIWAAGSSWSLLLTPQMSLLRWSPTCSSSEGFDRQSRSALAATAQVEAAPWGLRPSRLSQWIQHYLSQTSDHHVLGSPCPARSHSRL